MVTDTGRPSQKSQKSRKGKKAWRKNIDLDQIEQDIDDKNEQEIVLGPTNEPIFTLDRKGSDEGLTKEMKKERRLKSNEILYARSAVPALVSQHKKKDHPKTKTKIKDIKGILERAGFTDKATSAAQLERDGILKTGEVADLWDTPEPTQTKQRIVMPTPIPAASRKPAKPQAPIPGSVAVELPKAGLSYNPALDDWKAAILAEHEKLEKEEEKRLKAEEERARIEAVIAETESKISNDSDVEDESSEENDDNAVNDKLSVNPPAPLKRKTRTQRNRERRHKQWLHDLKQLKEKRRFMQSLLGQTEAESNDDQNKTPTSTTPRAPKRKLKAHSAYPVMEEPLAIKLSDELDDSLRRLKPEGSLLKERMRSFQARGLIEARVPVKKRKSRAKMVEKYSFKDFH